MSNIIYCWEAVACVRENSALVATLWKGWFRKLMSKYVIYHTKRSIWKNKSFPSDKCSAISSYCDCSSWRNSTTTNTNVCEMWRKENMLWSFGIDIKDFPTIFASSRGEVLQDYLQSFWLLCSRLSVSIMYTSKQLFSTLKIFEYSANQINT